MNIKFVWVPGEICRRTDLSMVEKVLISLVLGFQRKGGKFFGTVEWVAEQLGTKEENIWKAFERLEKKGILRREGDEWYVQQ